jgi:hypothetical protein
MIGSTHVSRGPRGDARIMDDRSPTARRFAEGLALKEGREAAITRTRNWLASGEPIEIILASDGRAFAIPRPAASVIRPTED